MKTVSDDEKKPLRKRMRALRLVADQKEGPNAAIGVMTWFLAALNDLAIGPGSVVAGYWPIATELDVRPLMARLDERGVTCALPVVTAGEQPLSFRRWRPTDELEFGERGTRHPRQDSPKLTPHLVLVPLLAFDEDGFRLGQGGGYYDRTLAVLRRRGAVTAVGVGFAVQRIDRLPRTPHDQRMDWILTEKSLMRVGP